jgi:hypothetical protein
MHAPRLPVAVLLGLLLPAACATVGAARQESRIRDLLDRNSIEKPLAEVWPEAMRVAMDRGFQLVGKDREALGLPSQGTWGNLLAKGHETQRLGRDGLVLETDQDGEGRRYRIEGRPAGAAASRVRFVVIQRHRDDPSEEESRDTDAEVELLRRVAPEAAAALLQAADQP